MSDNTTILTVAQVCERLTISEPTLRRYARAGVEDFPRKVRIGRRRVGYLKSDIEAYITSRYVAAGTPASAQVVSCFGK